jgi:hypothetical protein
MSLLEVWIAGRICFTDRPTAHAGKICQETGDDMRGCTAFDILGRTP